MRKDTNPFGVWGVTGRTGRRVVLRLQALTPQGLSI
jgi:hypothetical protein